jgi:iron complex outermembrane receptor protein
MLFVSWLLTAQETDLTTLSLEEFLKVEVVSVRKSLQRLSKTAAAVYVITQDDIRRSGAKSLPDALRLAPGVHVARVNGSLWAVGIRGYNGFYSRKLLVLIDGRTIYNPIMSGVIWSQQMVMLEDVERIEVIRGPAGSMWGANAVNGVINIITKRAQDTQGGLLAASADTLDPARVSVRYGQKSSDSLFWRTWLQHGINGQATLPAGWPGLNNWRATVGGMRADWRKSESDEIMVQGMVNDNRSDIHLLTSPGPMKPMASRGDSGGPGGFILGRWKHTHKSGDESVFQTSEDIQHTEMGVFGLSVQTFDLDFQRSVSLPGRHALLAGGGFRVNRIRTEATKDLWFDPAGKTYLVSNVFLQDEWQIRPDRFVLTMGAKLERYTFAGAAVQPTARAIWTPTPRQAYWAAVSGAVRTPSHADYALRFPSRVFQSQILPVTLLLSGNSVLRPEKLTAFDVGARWQASRKAALEIAGFYYFYKDGNGYHSPVALDAQGLYGVLLASGALTGASPPVIPVSAANNYAGRNRGGEVTLYYDLLPNFRLAASYSALFEKQYLRPGLSPMENFSVPYYSPHHRVQMRGSWEPGRNWTLDAAISRQSRLPSNISPVNAFTRVDLRVARKLGESFETFASGQDLLSSRRREFISDSLYPDGELKRSIQIGFTWRF